jgi:hypothetical protein
MLGSSPKKSAANCKGPKKSSWNMRRAQALLVSVFTIGLASQIVVVGYLSMEQAIRDDGFRTLLLTLLSVYSMPFAVILAGAFADRTVSPKRYSTFSFSIAITVTLLWNLLLCGRTAMFALNKEDSWRTVNAYLREVSTAASFLVAGTLTFFFTHGPLKRDSRHQTRSDTP